MVFKYLQEFEYHILVIELKINEWRKALYKGEGKKLHQNQENTTLQLTNYVPSYLEEKIPEDQKRLYKLFSLKVSMFENPEDWESLGVSPVACETISSFIKNKLLQKQSIELKDIESEIRKHPTLTIGTKNSALTALRNLINLGFFKYPEINFREEWKKGNVVVVSFPGGEGGRMNVVINKLVKKIEKIGIYERLNNLEITRKMLIFEDCSAYATQADSTSGIIKYIHNNLSAYGFNSLLTVQLPDLISPTLIDGCNIKIIGFINNFMAIRPHLTDNAYFELKNRKLFTNKDTFTFERLLIEDNEIKRFYPFDCMVGH